MQGLFEFIFEEPSERQLRQEMHKTILFNNLTSKELRLVSQKVSVRTFTKGQHVFFEGDAGSALYLILKGSIHIVWHSEGKIIPVTKLSQGMFFGELALVEDLPRSASAVVLEDATLAFLFRHDVEKLVHYHPKVGNKLLWNLSKVLARRLRAMNDRARRP